jgi:ketosteroid isomerase-like protein
VNQEINLKQRLVWIVLMAAGAGLACGVTLTAQGAAVGDDEAKAQIRRDVDTYMQSITNADLKLAATIWLTTPDATFIEPLGHERGWDEIASVVYLKLMGDTFSKRSLRNVSDVSIHLYGNAAVVEFDWDFVATLRSDGKTQIHTTGRESQMYVKFPDKGWRLVHVHYSGPPVSGPGKGF